jgi:hypothetical protein
MDEIYQFIMNVWTWLDMFGVVGHIVFFVGAGFVLLTAFGVLFVTFDGISLIFKESNKAKQKKKEDGFDSKAKLEFSAIMKADEQEKQHIEALGRAFTISPEYVRIQAEEKLKQHQLARQEAINYLVVNNPTTNPVDFTEQAIEIATNMMLEKRKGEVEQKPAKLANSYVENQRTQRASNIREARRSVIYTALSKKIGQKVFIATYVYEDYGYIDRYRIQEIEIQRITPESVYFKYKSDIKFKEVGSIGLGEIFFIE